MTDKDTPADLNAPDVPAGWPAQPAQPWDARPVAGTSVTTALPGDEVRAGAAPSWARAANDAPAGPPSGPPVVPAQAPPQTPPAGAAYATPAPGLQQPVGPQPAPGGPGGPSWFEADLGEGAHPAPAARRSPKLVAAAVVGAGALLFGGYAVGSSLGGSDTTQLAAQQGQGGQLGAPPGMSGQDGTGDMVVGQVTAVSGSTLTLSTRSGTATVTVTSSTTVDGTAGGDLSALTAGSLVFVRGTQGSDGTWTATSVGTTPPGMPGQQGQQGQGQQGQGQQGQQQAPPGGSPAQSGTAQGTTT